MPRPATKPRASRIYPRRRRYHHGNLKQALIDATVHLIEEEGLEKVTVREAAKRLGVSSGAPFRHFASKRELLTAVAEQTTRFLRDEVLKAIAEHADEGPLERFRALGDAYMRWVTQHPTQFRVVSDRSLVDFAGSESLRRDNDEMRSLMHTLLQEAQERGLLRAADLNAIVLTARAAAYGVARMYVDGHFAQWGVDDGDAERAFDSVFDVFVAGLRAAN